MLLLDVNICLHALYFDESDQARAVSRWLHDALVGDEPVGISDTVVAAMMRIGTNRRVYPMAIAPADVVEFAQRLRDAPRAVRVAPSERHWGLFAGLVRELDLTGNDVPDAFLAAQALENGATFVTRDRGFRRFPGLRVLDPLEAASG